VWRGGGPCPTTAAGSRARRPPSRTGAYRRVQLALLVAFREETLPAADDDRKHPDSAVIDESVLQERVDCRALPYTIMSLPGSPFSFETSVKCHPAGRASCSTQGLATSER